MAKFCGYCGTKLDDDAKVCGQCGTPVDGMQKKIAGFKIVNTGKRKKVKLILETIIIILVAITAVNIATKFTGYKGLLRKAMTAYKEYDIDTLVLLSSDMYYYGEDDWVNQYFEYNVGEDLDSFESSVGHSYSLSYEVNETYELSTRKLDTLLDTIESTYADFDVSAIKKVVVAEITVTAKQGSKSADKNLQVTMTKEDNSWKVLYME